MIAVGRARIACALTLLALSTCTDVGPPPTAEEPSATSASDAGIRENSADRPVIADPSAGAKSVGMNATPGVSGAGASAMPAAGASAMMSGADMATAAGAPGSPMCGPNQHLCGSQCASNLAPETCGTSCEPCPVPTGGRTECVDGKCQASCPASQQLCGSACIALNSSCQGMCELGKHDCAGVCSDNTSTATCGTSCNACPIPRDGVATCDGTRCDFRCSGLKCDDHCAPQCCTDSDCPTNNTCRYDGLCTCVPRCSGRQCGSDGCGNTCGSCSSSSTCNTASGRCMQLPTTSKPSYGNGYGGGLGSSVPLSVFIIRDELVVSRSQVRGW